MLLAPAVALMSRLRYPRKFLLISLLFGIPLALMMYLWLAQIAAQLAFTRLERDGLHYVRRLAQLIEPLERARCRSWPTRATRARAGAWTRSGRASAASRAPSTTSPTASSVGSRSPSNGRR